jgi:hypothetical protein
MTAQDSPSPLAQWLLFQTADADFLKTSLQSALQNAGYTFYDPFPGGTGTPMGLQNRVRSFIAPAEASWVRMLFAPNEMWQENNIFTELNAPVITIAYFSPDQFEIGAYQPNTAATGIAALIQFLRTGLTESDLRQAMNVAGGDVSASTSNELTPELQKFAEEQGVDTQQVDKLMQKMAGSVFQKMGDKGAQAEAKSAITGAAKQAAVDWNSAAGQAIKAVLGCLTVPENWTQPDWKTLTAAYQVARQLQRDPKAPMLPGDKDALKVLPNALEFSPLYMGKKSS